MPLRLFNAMELFDTHFHFDRELSPAEAYAEILATAAQVYPPGVEKLQVAAMGCDFASSIRAQSFAEAIPAAVFAVGVQPHDAEKYDRARENFTVFADHPRLVAVGEVGLDYYYEYTDRERQKAVFAEFLQLALNWEKPAVVHLRDQDEVFDAYRDGYELLADFAAQGGKFVVHCYTGGTEWLSKFAALGAWFGVTGMVTFKRADNIRMQLAQIPRDKLLLETDSPYLAPVPYRGKVNNPGYLPLVALAVAENWQIPVENVAGITTANARKFFQL